MKTSGSDTKLLYRLRLQFYIGFELSLLTTCHHCRLREWRLMGQNLDSTYVNCFMIHDTNSGQSLPEVSESGLEFGLCSKFDSDSDSDQLLATLDPCHFLNHQRLPVNQTCQTHVQSLLSASRSKIHSWEHHNAML